MSVSLGRGTAPRPPTNISTDSIVGTIVSFNSQNLQNGSNTGTTDANGGLTITFPKAFTKVPTTVVATVNGALGVNGPDYTCRLSGKKATDFTVKVLQGGVNWTSGLAVVSVNDTTITNVPYFAGAGSFSNDYAVVDTVAGNQAELYAATVSSGPTTQGFTGIKSASALPEVTVAAVGTSNSWSNGTVLTTVSGTTSGFVVTVSGFLTAAANVSVKIDWIAAA